MATAQAQARRVHIYDPRLQQVFYDDGCIECLPPAIAHHFDDEQSVDVLTTWARVTNRIGPDDEIAVLETVG